MVAPRDWSRSHSWPMGCTSGSRGSSTQAPRSAGASPELAFSSECLLRQNTHATCDCLLYTSDAADDM
eukprot:1703235-Alexandrium_andersonii.AAC.1